MPEFPLFQLIVVVRDADISMPTFTLVASYSVLEFRTFPSRSLDQPPNCKEHFTLVFFSPYPVVVIFISSMHPAPFSTLIDPWIKCVVYFMDF